MTRNRAGLDKPAGQPRWTRALFRRRHTGVSFGAGAARKRAARRRLTTDRTKRMAALTKTIASYAVSTSHSSLPDNVREQAKLVIFDEIACAHFGRRSIAGSLTARYVKTLGT